MFIDFEWTTVILYVVKYINRLEPSGYYMYHLL
jgi:hypothetical protein